MFINKYTCLSYFALGIHYQKKQCTEKTITNMMYHLTWSYGSLIYNYPLNQCVSPRKLRVWASAHVEIYTIQHNIIKVCEWLLTGSGFLWYSGFLQQKHWPTRYNRNIRWYLGENDEMHNICSCHQTTLLSCNWRSKWSLFSFRKNVVLVYKTG